MYAYSRLNESLAPPKWKELNMVLLPPSGQLVYLKDNAIRELSIGLWG